MREEKKNVLDFPMIRPVPYMGVIWVNHKAAQLGYVPGNPDWCNLGQGQPEEGEIAGAPERLKHLDLVESDYAYGPVGGTLELRQSVAGMMNRLYRKGKVSQYGPQNVTVASGGRIALLRFLSILSTEAKVLIRNPDYSAYEDLLGYELGRLEVFLEHTGEKEGFTVSPERLRTLAKSEGINTFLLSNPSNPAGSIVRGKALKEYCEIARKEGVLLALDEFYSHYIYEDGEGKEPSVSAARYVEDVEEDPVVIFDGLTKNHRYPGFRVSWIVGPSRVIEAINRAASALDGGASVAMQRLAVLALEPARFDAETRALRRCFKEKRDYVLGRLEAMGIHVPNPPEGTFYIWADISDLPESINNCDAFCLAALESHVLTIPGRFFDINPKREKGAPSTMAQSIRFSFGPRMEVLKEGLDRIEALIRERREVEEAA